MTLASIPGPGARPRLLLLVSLIGVLICGGTAVRAAGPGLRIEPLAVATHRGVRHFTVEIADTEATRERGLMFRKRLAGAQGMLFDFKTPRPVAFWMKNTLIPLDMLFIAPDGRVISIARQATPMSETPIPSGGDVLGVLEIRGGRAAEIGVQPGDHVRERIFHP
ncbi:MAG: hypothetical protein JWP28_2146 [Phenylobacterium sp.]|uniref:DUF192 domain-containing protein n=1 Tax=Phenylobacterium sp. TaxID=1871053 RepID=UPI0034443057|nr:hypothetical protein [Phenylobacterium sp.]